MSHVIVYVSRYLLNDLVVVSRNRLDNCLGGIRGAFDDLYLVGSDRDTSFHVGFEFSPQPSSLPARSAALGKHEAGSSGKLDAACSGASAELVDLRGV